MLNRLSDMGNSIRNLRTNNAATNDRVPMNTVDEEAGGAQGDHDNPISSNPTRTPGAWDTVAYNMRASQHVMHWDVMHASFKVVRISSRLPHFVETRPISHTHNTHQVHDMKGAATRELAA